MASTRRNAARPASSNTHLSPAWPCIHGSALAVRPCLLAASVLSYADTNTANTAQNFRAVVKSLTMGGSMICPFRKAEDEMSRVPDVRPTTVRFDEATYAAVQAECRRLGFKSMSDYIRQAIVWKIAWDRAMLAVQAGVDPSHLADTERLVALLEEVARTTERPD